MLLKLKYDSHNSNRIAYNKFRYESELVVKFNFNPDDIQATHEGTFYCLPCYFNEHTNKLVGVNIVIDKLIPWVSAVCNGIQFMIPNYEPYFTFVVTKELK